MCMRMCKQARVARRVGHAPCIQQRRRRAEALLVRAIVSVAIVSIAIVSIAAATPCRGTAGPTTPRAPIAPRLPSPTLHPTCHPIQPACNPIHSDCNPIHPVCNPMYPRSEPPSEAFCVRSQHYLVDC
eukprot:scaffold59009_cov45-Phaeocystis_antarctica.AAC.2